MSRQILLWLVVPLAVATIVSLLLSRCFTGLRDNSPVSGHEQTLLDTCLYGPFDGSSFFINLSTVFLGALITVLYVDWVVKTHEQQKWRIADTRIKKQVRAFAFQTADRMCDVLGFQQDFARSLTGKFPWKNLDKIYDVHAMVIEENVIPKIRERVQQLEPPQWAEVIKCAKQSMEESNRLLDLFSHRLSVPHSQLILEIQESLSAIEYHFQIIVAMYMLPEKELPDFLRGDESDPNRPAVFVAKNAAGENISQMLQKCIQLVRAIGDIPERKSTNW